MSKTLSMDDIQRFWLKEIERAEQVKRAWREMFRVEECYRAFLGDQRPDNYSEEDWFTLNLVFANIHAQIPSLYFQNPYFFVRLKRSYDPSEEYIKLLEKNMEVREGVLNYLVGENDLVEDGQLCILDAYFQFGILKARYVPSFELNPDAGKTKKSSTGKTMRDSNGEKIVEPDELLVGEKFVWERVNPNMFLVSPDAGNSEFPWSAEQHVDYYENIKNNPDYNTEGLEADATIRDYDADNTDRSDGFLGRLGGRARPKKMKDTPESEKLVTYYEIYDISRNQIVLVAKKCNQPLSKKPIPAGVEGHPYSFLRFNDNPGPDGEEMWYPIPEIYNQLGAQKEYNLFRNDNAIHRKRFRRKYGSQEGMLSPEQADKFEDPYDGAVIEFTDADWPAKFQPIQDASINPLDYRDGMQLRNDFYDISGSGPTSEIAGRSDTATEAELINNELQIRESDKQFRIRRFLIAGARNMHQLLEAQLKQEGAVRVVGPSGEYWQEYRKDSFAAINGEVMFDIDVSSMAPRNIQTERAQLMQFLQTAAQMPMIFQKPELLKAWAKKFDIYDNFMLQQLAEGFQEMTQMAQMNNGLLSNMPGGNAPISNTANRIQSGVG
jgi:hypothetical protein